MPWWWWIKAVAERSFGNGTKKKMSQLVQGSSFECLLNFKGEGANRRTQGRDREGMLEVEDASSRDIVIVLQSN